MLVVVQGDVERLKEVIELLGDNILQSADPLWTTARYEHWHARNKRMNGKERRFCPFDKLRNVGLVTAGPRVCLRAPP